MADNQSMSKKKTSLNQERSTLGEKYEDEPNQEQKQILYTPILSNANYDLNSDQCDLKTQESKKKGCAISNVEITDSSNQITNDRYNNPVNYKVHRIRNTNNNVLSADTFTYNESGEEVTSLSNSLNSLESGNIATINIHNEKSDQFVTLFDELSKMQTDDFKDLSNQRSILLDKIQKLLNIIEYYEIILKQEAEKRMIIENKDSQIQEQLNEFQSQNDFICQEIATILKDKLEGSSDNQIEDDFYSFIVNSFQKVINEYEKKIKNDYVEKNRYEILLQQLEQSIQLLSGISNMNEESSKKTYILTQCARIGHFIDEQMNYYQAKTKT